MATARAFSTDADICTKRHSTSDFLPVMDGSDSEIVAISVTDGNQAPVRAAIGAKVTNKRKS
jgi:hypothetical protein